MRSGSPSAQNPQRALERLAAKRPRLASSSSRKRGSRPTANGCVPAAGCRSRGWSRSRLRRAPRELGRPRSTRAARMRLRSSPAALRGVGDDENRVHVDPVLAERNGRSARPGGGLPRARPSGDEVDAFGLDAASCSSFSGVHLALRPSVTIAGPGSIVQRSLHDDGIAPSPLGLCCYVALPNPQRAGVCCMLVRSLRLEPRSRLSSR